MGLEVPKFCDGWFRVEPAGIRAKALPPMSKTVLGRGLGSLLRESDERARESSPGGPDAAGVQLLLRGADGVELVPPAPESAAESEARHAFPRWALAGAVVVDLILLSIAAWLTFTGHGWGRMVAASLLVLTGGAILGAAVWLRGQPAVRELESLNPLAEEKPRLRVQFMDELPRRRA